ncbi:MAG: nicotinate-nucleotide adenylyltransferase [Chitinophagales bacterium]|nr:nicotinate-nucleotide adenylyltransferase [Chitinophagales bacterium]
MKIGLFFGSFNPIHTGHLIIANYLHSLSDLDKVWFVVSPQNPFKSKSTLLNKYDRFHLVQLAVEDNDNLEASNIEFSMPLPSYTIDTLVYLKEKHPDKQFSLIMGSDNLKSFHKWKNHESILEDYDIYVYRRLGSDTHQLGEHSNVHIIDVPFIEISSTFIRESIKAGRSVKYFVPEPALKYIEEMNYYSE